MVASQNSVFSIQKQLDKAIYRISRMGILLTQEQ